MVEALCEQARKISIELTGFLAEYVDLSDQYLVLSRNQIKERRRLLNSLEELQGLIDHRCQFLEIQLPKIEIARAKEIMGEDLLGPAEISRCFGLREQDIKQPRIPLSPDELRGAKELGMFLTLRIDQFGHNWPVTMLEMDVRLRNLRNFRMVRTVHQNDDGKYEAESFYNAQIPRPGWALVTKELLPQSVSANPAKQTKLLADFLPRVAEQIPSVGTQVTKALADFEPFERVIEEGGIEENSFKDWLPNLLVNKSFRPTPVELMYDLFVYQTATGTRLLADQHSMTTITADSTENPFITVGAPVAPSHILASPYLISVGFLSDNVLSVERQTFSFAAIDTGTMIAIRGGPGIENDKLADDFGRGMTVGAR